MQSDSICLIVTAKPTNLNLNLTQDTLPETARIGFSTCRYCGPARAAIVITGVYRCHSRESETGQALKMEEKSHSPRMWWLLGVGRGKETNSTSHTALLTPRF